MRSSQVFCGGGRGKEVALGQEEYTTCALFYLRKIRISQRQVLYRATSFFGPTFYDARPVSQLLLHANSAFVLQFQGPLSYKANSYYDRHLYILIPETSRLTR